MKETKTSMIDTQVKELEAENNRLGILNKTRLINIHVLQEEVVKINIKAMAEASIAEIRLKEFQAESAINVREAIAIKREESLGIDESLQNELDSVRRKIANMKSQDEIERLKTETLLRAEYNKKVEWNDRERIESKEKCEHLEATIVFLKEQLVIAQKNLDKAYTNLGDIAMVGVSREIIVDTVMSSESEDF